MPEIKSGMIFTSDEIRNTTEHNGASARQSQNTEKRKCKNRDQSILMHSRRFRNACTTFILALVFKFITCVASENEAQEVTPSGLRRGCK